MLSYLRIHVGLLVLVALVGSACTSASPKMSVIGVKAPRVQRFDSPSVKVFVEVHNPTHSDLSLEKLKYRLVAVDWFDSKGVVQVERVIAAGASAIVEILVPVQNQPKKKSRTGVPYTLKARLYASTDKTSRSWELTSKGSLANSRQAQMANRRVASGN